MSRNQAAGAANSGGVGKAGQKVGRATPRRIRRGTDATTQLDDELWKKRRTLEQALDTIDRKTR